MGDKSAIEWTDATWNPVRGCSRVSEGCRNCYAEKIAKRFSGPDQPYEGLIAKGGQWNGTVKFAENKLTDPLRWKKPRRIFVNSMSDLFHESIPDEWIDQIFAVMALAQHHTFQVLTKRPERMRKYLTGHAAGGRHVWTAGQLIKMPRGQDKPEPGWPLPNVWLGVSVEDQLTANERIPQLLQAPAAVRFISAEPLLGEVLLHEAVTGDGECRHEDAYVEDDTNAVICSRCENGDDVECIDWVIVGGESTPNARPMHPDWARSLRDQCVEAGTALLFKQWGEWAPIDAVDPSGDTAYHWDRQRFGQLRFECMAVGIDGDVSDDAEQLTQPEKSKVMYRFGKKLAGRMLDERTWDEFPRAGT